MTAVYGPRNPLERRWRDLPLHDFSEARCTGLSWMFDSTDPATHLEAAKLCAECPVQAECGEHFLAVRAACSGVAHGGGPSGTWAGRLISKTGRPKRVA
jgi:hypothetical protein